MNTIKTSTTKKWKRIPKTNMKSRKMITMQKTIMEPDPVINI